MFYKQMSKCIMCIEKKEDLKKNEPFKIILNYYGTT